MPAGRPAQSSRSQFGERLYQLREQRGFSQKHMAEKLSITQQSYAAWERRSTALKPEQLASLATILNCSLDELLGREPSKARGPGPVGRTRKVFEQVSQLPRARQQRIVRVVEDLIAAQRLNGTTNGAH